MGEEHRPRWFKRTMDADFKEFIWEPVITEDGDNGEAHIEYWVERSRVGMAKRNGEEGVWKDVQPIL